MKNTKPVTLAETPVTKPDGPSHRDRVLNKFAFVAMAFVALAIGLMIYWGTANTEVLDIHNAPFPTRTIREHPTAGGVVILDVDYCKNIDAEGDLRMSFVSASREVFLPVTKEKGGKGCVDTEFPVLIPKEIIADTYRIKFRLTYDINPLKQNVVQEFESQPVIVDESVSNPDRKTQLTQ